MPEARDTLNESVGAGVYPSSFFNGRLLLFTMLVTQAIVFVLGIGRSERPSFDWWWVVSAYSQSVALFCLLGLGVVHAWLLRLDVRGAWVACWLLTLILGISWSYCMGVIGTVMGIGPGSARLPGFVFQNLLAVALVGGGTLRYLYVRAQWQAEVTAQAEARVQALQARIRPHFLFNSLNTIASLIPEQPQAAEQAILDLADLFRGSMRRADRLIELSEELNLAYKYLEMEQRRLGERMHIEWEVDDLPGSARVTPLLLQPLLENAVAHGVQRCTTPGTVRVFGRLEGEQIVITINNPLPEEEAAGAPTAPHHGMALRNIRSRLALAYGERAKLLTEESDQEFFTVLTLPYVEHSDR